MDFTNLETLLTWFEDVAKKVIDLLDRIFAYFNEKKEEVIEEE